MRLLLLLCIVAVGCKTGECARLGHVRHLRARQEEIQEQELSQLIGEDVKESHGKISRPLFSWDLVQTSPVESHSANQPHRSLGDNGRHDNNGQLARRRNNAHGGVKSSRKKRRRGDFKNSTKSTSDIHKHKRRHPATLLTDASLHKQVAKKVNQEDIPKHQRLSKDEHRKRDKNNNVRRKNRKNKGNGKKNKKNKKKNDDNSRPKGNKKKKTNNSLEPFSGDFPVLKLQNEIENSLNSEVRPLQISKETPDDNIINNNINIVKEPDLKSKEEEVNVVMTENKNEITENQLVVEILKEIEKEEEINVVLTENKDEISENIPVVKILKEIGKEKEINVVSTENKNEISENQPVVKILEEIEKEEEINVEMTENKNELSENQPVVKILKEIEVKKSETDNKIPDNYYDMLAEINKKLSAENRRKLSGNQDEEENNIIPTSGVEASSEIEDNLVPILSPTPSREKRPCAKDSRGGCEQLCHDIKGLKLCSCYKGFRQEGKKCHDINECLESNGGCERGCRNTLGSYHCFCPSGLRLSDNQKTCRDVNECLLRNGHGPCQDTCTNELSSYTCSCEGIPGTQLAANNHTCEDLDECSKDNAGCSHTCLNTLGNAFCLCPTGFMLGNDWKTCQDIDECRDEELQNELCPERCINTVGSYQCAPFLDCPLGFTEGTLHCEDIDECEQNNNCSQLCINTNGSHHCACEPGYEQDEDQKTCHIVCQPGFKREASTCEDIDECNEENDCSQICMNTNGSYHCNCKEEYELDDDQKTCLIICRPGFKRGLTGCEDINECHKENNCSQICINTNGSYRCDCNHGYNLHDDNKTCHIVCPRGFERGASSCEDVDECADNDENDCSQLCINIKGSYYCDCHSGYTLQDDKQTCRIVCPPGFESVASGCKDINECDTDSNYCSQLCINTNGSFHCACMLGYKLQEDKKECHIVCPLGFKRGASGCEDVDECDTDLNDCSQMCVNTEGGFHCACKPGYRLHQDGTTCHHVCPRGFKRGAYDCEDIDECEDSPCSQSCVNTNGSYHCICKLGYMLQEDRKSCKAVRLNAVCPPLDTPLHGYLECSRLSLRSGPWRYRIVNHSGSFCELRCPKGYRIVGVYRKFCGQNGRWLGMNYGTCIRH